MSQTAYSIQAPRAFPGLLADGNADAHIRSLANDDAADAAFGLGYTEGTDPETQFEAFTGATNFAGVLAHRHQSESRDLFTGGGAGGGTGVKEGEPGDIVSKGRVWVVTNEQVAAGDDAFVVNAVGDIGQFRNDNTNAQQVSGVFRAAASATLALLELNEP